ncbi:MAG: helix-turn-helix domain-containing protein [Mobilitalea sp.]
MSLVNRIQNLCKANNTSLSRLGLELGLGKSSISRWNTNTPSIDKIQKIAEYFDASVDYLLGLTDDPQPRREGEVIFHDVTDDERVALEAFLNAYREQKNKT